MVGGCIPLLGFSGPSAGAPAARERLGSELTSRSGKVGSDCPRGHWMPMEPMDATFAETARFHPLPLKTKLRLNALTPGRNRNEAFSLHRRRTPHDPAVMATKRFRDLCRPRRPAFVRQC